MNTLSPRERARRDVKNFSRNRKIKGLSNVAILGGLGASGAGAYLKNKKMMGAGLSTAFLAGMLRGKASKKEDRTLKHLRKFYDLRDFKKPVLTKKTKSMKKTAYTPVGLANEVMHHAPGIGVQLSHYANQIVDILPAIFKDTGIHIGAALAGGPYVAKRATNWLRGLTMSGARKGLGLKISPKEKFWTGIAEATQGGREALKNFRKKRGPIIGAPASVAEYLTRSIGGPVASSGPLGTGAADIAKKMEPYVGPKLTEQAIQAIGGGRPETVFKREVLKRMASYRRVGKTLDSIIDEVPLARRAVRSTGKSTQQRIRELIEDPKAAEDLANKIKESVRGGLRAGKVVGGGAGLASLGYLIGKRDRKHPLASSNLPAVISDYKY